MFFLCSRFQLSTDASWQRDQPKQRGGGVLKERGKLASEEEEEVDEGLSDVDDGVFCFFIAIFHTTMMTMVMMAILAFVCCCPYATVLSPNSLFRRLVSFYFVFIEMKQQSTPQSCIE